MAEGKLIKLDQRALIVNPEGEILLVNYEDSGEWDLPGGIFSGGATWREDLEEVLEKELGIGVMTRQPIHAADFLDPETGDFTYMTVVECVLFSETGDIDTNEYNQAKWYKPEEIAEVSFMVYEIKQAILDYIIVE